MKGSAEMSKNTPRRSTLYFVVCLCILLVFPTGCKHKERKLHVAIVGSIDNDDPQYDPSVICRPQEVRLLLLDMADSPMTGKDIEARLRSTETQMEDLLRIESIRKEEGLYYINFPLFTEADEAIIHKVAEKYSRLLADNLLKKKPEIYALLDQYQPANVGKDKLAFIAVGCLSLDWGALDLLSKYDYIIYAPEKAGGNSYVLNAEEVTEFSLKEIYWGGHSTGVDGMMFMTFGDHHTDTKRNSIPDILWFIESNSVRDVPDLYQKEWKALLQDQLDNLMEETGRILYALKQSPLSAADIQQSSEMDEQELQHILDFLEKIHFVSVKEDVYSLDVLLFTGSDQVMLSEIKEIVNREILSWVESHYKQIKLDLEDISAVRNRVDYKEVFNMMWHYFFGYTNKYLAEAGFIYDTYQAPEGRQGYLPAVMIRRF
jgi:hypothetical protein